ncbi:hypothetical protein NHF45_12845 [Maricaulaceae bacterium NA33B04]|nr:hypothetical protein [Maricaulaceae bacterium NA33B04]
MLLRVPLKSLLALPFLLIVGCSTTDDYSWADLEFSDIANEIASRCDRYRSDLGAVQWIRTTTHRDRLRITTDLLVPRPGEPEGGSTLHVVISAADFSRATLTTRDSFPEDDGARIDITCADNARCFYNETTGEPLSFGRSRYLYCSADDEAELIDLFQRLQEQYRNDPGLSERIFLRGQEGPESLITGDSYPLMVVMAHQPEIGRLDNLRRRVQNRGGTSDIQFDRDGLTYDSDDLGERINDFLSDIQPPRRTISDLQVVKRLDFIDTGYAGFFYYAEVSPTVFLGTIERDGSTDICHTTISISRAHTTAAAETHDLRSAYFGPPRVSTPVHACGAEHLARQLSERLAQMVNMDW